MGLVRSLDEQRSPLPTSAGSLSLRTNPHGRTAAGGQVQHQLRGAADLLLLNLGVRRTLTGVGRIGVDLGNRATFPQEVERDLQVAGIPVGKTPEEPLLA